MKKVWLSWSTGKDSAWAFHTLRMDGNLEVAGLFTTVTDEFSRVSVHGTRVDLLDIQAENLGLPLYKAVLPWPCTNIIYQETMESVWAAAIDRGVQLIAFGDLFLEDIRQYRIDILKETDLKPIFPIWGLPTSELAQSMLSSGLKATITSIDPKHLPAELAGRQYDAQFLDNLPPHIDPCGENGEFHTFCHAGPMFSNPIPVRTGEIVHRGGFIYADVMLNEEHH